MLQLPVDLGGGRLHMPMPMRPAVAAAQIVGLRLVGDLLEVRRRPNVVDCW